MANTKTNKIKKSSDVAIEKLRTLIYNPFVDEYGMSRDITIAGVKFHFYIRAWSSGSAYRDLTVSEAKFPPITFFEAKYMINYSKANSDKMIVSDARNDFFLNRLDSLHRTITQYNDSTDFAVVDIELVKAELKVVEAFAELDSILKHSLRS